MTFYVNLITILVGKNFSKIILYPLSYMETTKKSVSRSKISKQMYNFQYLAKHYQCCHEYHESRWQRLWNCSQCNSKSFACGFV